MTQSFKGVRYMRQLMVSLWVLAVTITLGLPAVGAPPSDPFPAVCADPAVPLLQLPGRFQARRTNSRIQVVPGQPFPIFAADGAGCIRHCWFVFGQREIAALQIVIEADGTGTPQVRMPFRSFFGALLGFDDYHIDSAGLVNFPNFTVGNDPLLSPAMQPGWNCYLPIPFAKGCRIWLESTTPVQGASMIDWQHYPDGIEPPAFRLHAQRNIALPANPAEPFRILETRGIGFLAGFCMGYRQQNHDDMVFHNSGTRILVDGATDPQHIDGMNVEDDFGFAWGFNQYQSRWVGCPYRANRGRNDQDGVFYRFFGPDPIPYRESLVFTSIARGDDYESVAFYYQIPEKGADGPTENEPANGR